MNKAAFALICRQKGFTLIELLIVMTVFIIVIVVAGDSFNRILVHSNRLSQNEESNIEGVVGLEMLRHDMNQAGFGLPWAFSSSNLPVYSEAGGFADKYNDSTTTTRVPRAFLAGNNLDEAGVLTGTDYLVIKGTALAPNETAQKWTYMYQRSLGDSKPKIWPSGNLEDKDKVIVIRRRFSQPGGNESAEKSVNELRYDDADPDQFYVEYKKDGFDESTLNVLSTSSPQDVFYIFGLSKDEKPRMPFNRADYFVRTDEIPDYCAPNTGVLNKAVLNKDGGYVYYPLLNCVADMQVVFGWDLDDNGVIDAYSDPEAKFVNGGDSATVLNTGNDPELLRARLKLVKVYLMVQNGRRDRNFTNTQTVLVGGKGEGSLTNKHELDKNKDWENYRWKVYRIIVNPKNLTLK